MLKLFLPYPQDSGQLFAQLRQKPWAIFLESRSSPQYVNYALARYDILVADPFLKLTTKKQGYDFETTLEQDGSKQISHENPWQLLRRYLCQYSVPSDEEVPFSGGAIGYFAYDLANEILSQEVVLQMGFYDWAIIVDHQEKRAWLVSYLLRSETKNICESLYATLCEDNSLQEDESDFQVLSPLTSLLTKSQYISSFTQIQKYIQQGDCYQINFSQEFSVKTMGDSFRAYQYLRKYNPAPFMAYLIFDDLQILSCSPERFLKVDENKKVETRPIKGTRRRLIDPVEDARQIELLQNSLKDRAENLMIVDLLRNDLGKICVPHTIHVKQLFVIESYASVHHLVSIIEGILPRNNMALDVLISCFPGGSITGAPKRKAMQIIDALELHSRKLYCGSIAYLGFDGRMDSNIAIRTAISQAGEMKFCAGGGIVVDSTPEREYQEILDKAESFIRMVKSFS